jgi:hypothetical protein
MNENKMFEMDKEFKASKRRLKIEESSMTLSEFFETIYPLLVSKTMDRVEKVLADGTRIKAYWAGTIIRIDIAP